MDSYRVLVVAPKTDLALQADEAMQLVNILGAKLLQGGRANLHGLLDMMGQDWDIFWFASHGSVEGIHLSDGILSASEITSLIRSVGVRLTVLNTCESYEVARTIHRELGTDLVATIKPLPDRQAYVTATLFAQKLAEGFSPYDAYELAKPGQNTTYEFFQAAEQPRMSRLTDWPGKAQQSQPQRIEEQLVTIQSDLRRIEAIVSGNQQWNVEGVVPRLSDVAKRVEHLQEDFKDMRRAQIFNQRLLIALSVVCIILMMTVALLVLQGFT